MRILVLGSHGCVGSAVMRYFQQKGHQVIPWDIKMGQQFDLRKKDVLESVLPEVDFVLFLAFDVGGSKYNVNSLEYIENNTELMRHTFNSLEKYKKPFIHTSSMMSNMNNNPYSVMKRLGELSTDILGGINVKLWNVYGSEPITEKSHVIPDFIHQAIHNGTIQMRTSGKEERLFLYCDDFASAIYILFERYAEFVGKGPIDVSCDTWITIKDIANLIKNLTKEIMNKDIEVLEGTYVDTFHAFKNQPSKSLLDTFWKPKISIEDGIRKVLQAMI